MDATLETPIFFRVTESSDADALLQLMKRSMMFYAQEAQIPLYRKNGSYTLAALNETRGDILEAIQSEDFFAVEYKSKIVASVRLVTDYDEQKSLLTRFSVEPKLRKTDFSSFLMKSAIYYLQSNGIREVYLYTAIENERMMEFYKEHKFQLYSVNNGRPYPKACLIRVLS